jgi:hypothetical protein
MKSRNLAPFGFAQRVEAVTQQGSMRRDGNKLTKPFESRLDEVNARGFERFQKAGRQTECYDIADPRPFTPSGHEA